MLAHTGRYDAAVVARIEGRTPVVPMSTLAALTDATVAITRLDTAHGATAAAVATLLRSEAAASSRLANLTASTQDVLSAELDGSGRTNAGVVAATARAITAGLGAADRLDSHAVLDMRRALVADTRPDPPSQWRDVQVWVGGGAWGPHTAQFVPPHATEVPAAMTDLLAFMRRDDLPPLLLAALTHAQFETIRPFPDGNDRVARALVHALLRTRGVTHGLTVPISAGLMAQRPAYPAALAAYRAGDPVPVIEHFIAATLLAVESASTLIADIHAVRSAWDDIIAARAGATVWRVADLLTEQPLLDSRLVQTRLGVSAPTANAAIEHLVTVGVLTQVAGDQRARRWAALQIIAPADAFVERARHS